MSDERIEKTKLAVEAADHISAAKKAELSAALSKLQPAIAKVSKTHQEDAESIARLVEASTHEATRRKKRPKLLETLLRALTQSVEDFEASHPDLVGFVGEYSTLLANMGL